MLRREHMLQRARMLRRAHDPRQEVLRYEADGFVAKPCLRSTPTAAAAC